MSDLGRFDAEQRERLRQFVEQVLERASREEALSLQNPTNSAHETPQQQDLQAMIDELRAETAQLRAELQRYRSHSN